MMGSGSKALKNPMRPNRKSSLPVLPRSANSAATRAAWATLPCCKGSAKAPSSADWPSPWTEA